MKRIESRLSELEQRLKPPEPGHVLEVYERYADGSEKLLWTEPNSTASFSKIIIEMPLDSDYSHANPSLSPSKP